MSLKSFFTLEPNQPNSKGKYLPIAILILSGLGASLIIEFIINSTFIFHILNFISYPFYILADAIQHSGLFEVSKSSVDFLVITITRYFFTLVIIFLARAELSKFKIVKASYFFSMGFALLFLYPVIYFLLFYSAEYGYSRFDNFLFAIYRLLTIAIFFYSNKLVWLAFNNKSKAKMFAFLFTFFLLYSVVIRIGEELATKFFNSSEVINGVKVYSQSFTMSLVSDIVISILAIVLLHLSAAKVQKSILKK